jgi:hypothetical protein
VRIFALLNPQPRAARLQQRTGNPAEGGQATTKNREPSRGRPGYNKEQGTQPRAARLQQKKEEKMIAIPEELNK